MPTDNENKTEELLEWVRRNSKDLIKKICPPDLEKHTHKKAIFMAGSPGAGKTEFAREVAEESLKKHSAKLCNIEQDKIKELLPGYRPELAERYHRPASLGVDKVYGHVLKKGISFILDSTFSQHEKAKNNIERVLRREYSVTIYFVYQEPGSAWHFVKERQRVEGRPVPRESFIRQFLGSQETVNKIKEEFGKKVDLTVIRKTIPIQTSDGKNGGKMETKVFINVDRIDPHVKNKYTTYKELDAWLPE